MSGVQPEGPRTVVPLERKLPHPNSGHPHLIVIVEEEGGGEEVKIEQR